MQSAIHGKAGEAPITAGFRKSTLILVSPGLRVLEIGCATGSILAAVRPARGVGVDFSPEMLNRAHMAHPEHELIRADADDLSSVRGPFDTIILSDLVNDLWDVQRVFEEIRRLSIPSTRVILNFHSGLWQLPLAIAQRLNIATRHTCAELADARGCAKHALFGRF